MSKVSIVIPVYEAEPYLEGCIRSILAQTFSDFELLLIDDGSPDKSGELCDKLATQDSRIKVFHKPNGGATSARKYGVGHASGEWILFSDADDEMPKDAIANLMACDNGKCELIAGTIYYQSIDRLITSETQKDLLQPREYITLLLDRKSYYGPCSKLIKRNLFNDLEWLEDKDVFQNEDLLMLVQLAAKMQACVAVCNGGMHYVCISREGSASSRKMSYKGWRLLFENIESTLKSRELFAKEVKASYVNYVLWTLKSFCINKKIMVPNDKYIHRILSYAKDVVIQPYAAAGYKDLTFRPRLYFQVYARKFKHSIQHLICQSYNM